MSTFRAITEQDLARIDEKVRDASRERRIHHKRAKRIATLGHVGFCIGLFLAGVYLFYMMMSSVGGVFPQWYAIITQTLHSVLPEFVKDSAPELLVIVCLPLVCSFACALIGLISGVFISEKRPDGESVKNKTLKDEAETLRNLIEYNRSHYRVRWDKYYPKTIHSINLYNFIPWLTFLVAMVVGMLVVSVPEEQAAMLALGMVVPIIFTIPIVLLWKLSAIINSVFYRGSRKITLYEERYQLNQFLAPYDQEKREHQEKEQIEKRKQAAEKRDRAYAAEKEGSYSLAKELYKEAAEMGDALAMDNYARHCLIDGHRLEATRWLQRCIDTGEAGAECEDLLRALKNGEHINATYCG